MFFFSFKSSDSSQFYFYLKRTNFHVYIFLQISQILIDFAKLNIREIIF